MTQNGATAEVPDDQCGYTYPEDPDRISILPHANSCVRDPLPDTGLCKVHAAPSETEHKFDRLGHAPPDGDSLDGAILPGEFAVTIGHCEVSLLRGADLSDAFLGGADLSEADLYGADLSGASLSEADLSEANLRGANLYDVSPVPADLSGADLRSADLSGASLSEADLSGASLSEADLSGANLSDADLSGAGLLIADLSWASLGGADLSGADLRSADLSRASSRRADFSEADLDRADLSEAELYGADLSDANLHRADLSGAYLDGADLSGADLGDADLSEADLDGADLSGANLQQATVVDVNLFDADLTRVRPYQARIEAVQVNDSTEFHADPSEYARWWQREGSFLAAPPRCGYDPTVKQPDDAADTDQEELLSKAADTYRQFEELARRNAQPALQSSMFVLRQDMQRKRYWTRGQYGQWFANRVFRTVFKHGESFARILLTATALVLLFALTYWQFDLIVTNPEAATQAREFIDNPFDAIYFSTLTFTTLGLGDFQPAATSEFGRMFVLFEATLGAILIATFVFVLGRRAAR